MTNYLFKHLFIIVAASLVLTACTKINISSLPYKASTRNIIAIQEALDPDVKVAVASVAYASGFNPDVTCRLAGDIIGPSGKPIPEYIQEAFEEELFAAGRLDIASDTQIEIEIEHLKFTSVLSIYWKIELNVSSNHYNGYSITSEFFFKTDSSCKDVGDAFGSAVQGALTKVITHPNFSKLAGN